MTGLGVAAVKGVILPVPDPVIVIPFITTLAPVKGASSKFGQHTLGTEVVGVIVGVGVGVGNTGAHPQEVVK